jgi:hypothetical protein
MHAAHDGAIAIAMARWRTMAPRTMARCHDGA